MSELDPSLPLRKASVAALEGSTALATAMGGAVRVYDAIPDGAAFPYITFDHAQAIPDDGDCDLGCEVYLTWSVWSRAQGTVEAETIANLAATLLNANLSVVGHTVVIHQVSLQHMQDPDDLTAHSVITARYETAAAA